MICPNFVAFLRNEIRALTRSEINRGSAGTRNPIRIPLANSAPECPPVVQRITQVGISMTIAQSTSRRYMPRSLEITIEDFGIGIERSISVSFDLASLVEFITPNISAMTMDSESEKKIASSSRFFFTRIYDVEPPMIANMPIMNRPTSTRPTAARTNGVCFLPFLLMLFTRQRNSNDYTQTLY